MVIRLAGLTALRRVRLLFRIEWLLLRMVNLYLLCNSRTLVSRMIYVTRNTTYWLLVHLMRNCGRVSLVLVTLLIFSVAIIGYVCVLPHKMAESAGWTVLHLTFGHWLLLNVCFHLYKAAMTDPGRPPSKIPGVATTCRKCSAPKPPRCHHCSVCKRCVLKMDHHCPWLNNCVGHNNHRYYFLFCVYLWIGFIYVSVSTYPLFREQFYGDGARDIGWTGFFYLYYIFKGALSRNNSTLMADNPKSVSINNIHQNDMVITKPTHDVNGSLTHVCVIYEFMLCSGMIMIHTTLVVMQARHISKGETTIEVYINELKSLKWKRKGKVYTNPYDFGKWINWKRFLGITHRRTFWRHILLPSSHPPPGDGIVWERRKKKFRK